MATRNFKTLRGEARRKNSGHEKRVAEYRRAMEDALALAQLRETQDVTQSELAVRLDVSQGNISLLEQRAKNGQNIYVSTLSEYVAALGGRLEIHVVFDQDAEDMLLTLGNGETVRSRSR